jgi:hypothetical protein
LANKGEGRGAHRVWWENVSERENLRDIGIVWSIIVNWIFQTYDGGVYWIILAQNGEK